MSFLKKLFGSKEPETPKSEDYNGFKITAQPMPGNPGYRICALIEKDGRSHTLIRADTLNDLDSAKEASVAKAKQMIDQQGDQVLD